MTQADTVRELPDLNSNYSPPRPWRCVTHAEHNCAGPVVGAVGAYPVCAAGAVAEQAARQADRARIAAWANSPEGRRTLAEEARMERWIETRGSF